jgi:uncharacterized protein
MMNAEKIIQELQMQKHPEGGYYKETYRCNDTINISDKKRNISTAIYFLLENDDKSHFHRIKSDELWFFHQGNALEILIIENNNLRTITLGNDLVNGETPQTMVPANCWFASRLKNKTGYGLVSCTVAPGFDFEDFEMAQKTKLISQHPKLEHIINEMALN